MSSRGWKEACAARFIGKVRAIIMDYRGDVYDKAEAFDAIVHEYLDLVEDEGSDDDGK